MNDTALRQLILQANELIKRNETAAAAALLKQVLQADPRQPDAWFLLAGTMDDPAKQRQIIERVLQLDPDHHKAREALAWLDSRAGVTPGTPKRQPANRVLLLVGGTLAVLGGLYIAVILLGSIMAQRIATTMGTDSQRVFSASTPPPTATTDPRSVSVKLFEAQPVEINYSSELDRVVYISRSPNLLHLVNPADGSERTIALLRAPLSLAVLGKRAVVGHDAQLSSIDLEAETVLRVFEVEFPVRSFLLSPRGWVYFEETALELETGRQVKHLLDSTSHLRYLDASGSYILEAGNYIYWNRLPPPGAPESERPEKGLVYEDPENRSSVLFLAPDNRRIVTSAGQVLALAESLESPAYFEGRLSISSSLNSVAFLPEAKRLVVANGPSMRQRLLESYPISQVAVYEYDSLRLLGIDTMPNVQVGDQRYMAAAQQVFAARDGKHYHVILKIAEAANLPNGFTLLTRSLDDLPTVPAPGETETIHITLRRDALADLPFNALDGEYSSALQRVVLIADNPARLILLDPWTGEGQSVILPHAPQAVSLSPDGRTAAVGHDRRISLVTLEPFGALRTLDLVGHIVHDVALSGDGWVYFVSQTQATNGQIRCIETVSGAEGACKADSVNLARGIRLSPDGKALFGVYNNDLEQFEIVEGGRLSDVREVIGNNNPPWSGLWLSADGTRLFGAGPAVYRLPPVPEGTPSPPERLTGENTQPDIIGLGYSSAMGQLVALVKNGSRQRIMFIQYDEQTLQEVHQVELMRDVGSPNHFQVASGFAAVSPDGTQAFIWLSPYAFVDGVSVGALMPLRARP